MVDEPASKEHAPKAQLEELRVRGFRNLEAMTWRPVSGAQLLVGGNGTGKTSFLEAVYLTATTRSFRTPKIATCVQHGKDGFDLLGEVKGVSRSRLTVRWQQGERFRAVNGTTGPLAEHLAVLPVVAWTGRDKEVLTGSPSLRRKFLDRGVVGRSPSAIRVLGQYRQILSQKRQALIRGDRALSSWNELLASAASDLMGHRADYVRSLRERTKQIISQVGLDLPEIRLSYRPSFSGNPEPNRIYAALEESASKELGQRRPLIGPHLDDLGISLGGHSLRSVGSAGERKALGLILTAAHAGVLEDSGNTPILLLDDVDTELSVETLTSLWQVFTEGPQLLATSNRREIVDAIPFSRIWRVEGGRISFGE